jgi:hypothetical protein
MILIARSAHERADAPTARFLSRRQAPEKDRCRRSPDIGVRSRATRTRGPDHSAMRALN